MNRESMSAHTTLLFFRAYGRRCEPTTPFYFKGNKHFMSDEKMSEMKKAIKMAKQAPGILELTKDHLSIVDGFLESLKNSVPENDNFKTQIDRRLLNWVYLEGIGHSIAKACNLLQADRQTKIVFDDLERLIKTLQDRLPKPLNQGCGGTEIKP